MRIDDYGNVYYYVDNEIHVWCIAQRLTEHLHRLKQITARGWIGIDVKVKKGENDGR